MAKSLDAVIRTALEKKIGEKVWKVLKDHIEKDVYAAYKPEGEWGWGTKQDSLHDGYQRRREKGLLNEADKYIDVDYNAGTDVWRLRVSTNAQPSESVLGQSWKPYVGGFLRLLEEGNLGFWSKSFDNWYHMSRVTHPFPRPVITNAQEEANQNRSKYEAELYAAINKAISGRSRGSK